MDFLRDIAINILSDGISFLLGALFAFLLSFLKKSDLDTSTVKKFLFRMLGVKKIPTIVPYKKNQILAG